MADKLDSDVQTEDKKKFWLELTKSVLIFAAVCGLAAMFLGYNFSTCVYVAGGMKVCYMAANHAIKQMG